MGRRKKCIESYKVVGISSPPLTRFIPLDPQRRKQLWKEFREDFGIDLPDYNEIVREHLSPEDLRVLWAPYWEQYEYRGGEFHDHYSPGYITDGASVPTIFSLGSLTKDGQHIQEPANDHDKDFAEKVFSFFDSNCLFRARINQQEQWGNKRAGKTKRRFSFGVNTPIGKRLYKRSTPGENWLTGYYQHSVLREMEW